MTFIKVKYLLFIIFLSPLYVNAQQNDDEDDEKVSLKVEILVDELVKNGIDSIIVYDRIFVGGVRVVAAPIGASEEEIDSLFCEVKDAVYVCWIFKGNTHLLKIHPCFTFQTVDNSVKKIAKFLKKNPGLLLTPTIETYLCEDKEGKEFTVYRDHREVRHVSVQLGDLNKEMVIDCFNLLKKADSQAGINKNYHKNRRNLGYLLSEVIENEIQKIQFQKVSVNGMN